MARTKHPARKAVGGKAPRKQLASKPVNKRKLRNWGEEEHADVAPSAKIQNSSPNIALSALPVEILVNVVCKFLKFQDVLALSGANREIHHAIHDQKNDEKIWKQIVISQIFGYQPVDTDLKKYYTASYRGDESDEEEAAKPSENVHERPRLWFRVVKNVFLQLKGNMIQNFKQHGVSFSQVYKVYDLQHECIKFETRTVESEDNEVSEQSEALQAQQFAVGESRIGGYPDYPANLSLPTRKGGMVALLAQFNITHLKLLDIHNQLPDDGMLWIFHPIEADSTEEDSHKNPYIVVHMSTAEIRQHGGLVRRTDHKLEENPFRPGGFPQSYLAHPVKLEMLPISLRCNYMELPTEIASIVPQEVYNSTIEIRRPTRLQLFGHNEDGENIFHRSNCRMYWKHPLVRVPKSMLRNKQAAANFIQENNSVYYLIQNESSNTNARQMFENWVDSIPMRYREGFTNELKYDFRKAYRHIPNNFYVNSQVDKGALPRLFIVRQFPEEGIIGHEDTVSKLDQQGMFGSNPGGHFYTMKLYKQLESEGEEVSGGFWYELPYKFISVLREANLLAPPNEDDDEDYKVPDTSFAGNYPTPASYVNLLRLSLQSLEEYWQCSVPVESFENKSFEGCVLHRQEH